MTSMGKKTSIDAAFAQLLTESKEFARRKPRKKAKSILDVGKVVFAERTEPGLATIKNPWKDESLVQIMTITTCRKCGNTGTAWEEFIFLERTRKIRGSLETLITRIETCAYEDLYKDYKKRIEVREVSSCSCPQCFPDFLSSKHGMIQRDLPLDGEKET